MSVSRFLVEGPIVRATYSFDPISWPSSDQRINQGSKGASGSFFLEASWPIVINSHPNNGAGLFIVCATALANTIAAVLCVRNHMHI